MVRRPVQICKRLLGSSCVVKLPRARVEALLATGNGRVIGEWVVVRSAEPVWAALAREARHFVRAQR